MGIKEIIICTPSRTPLPAYVFVIYDSPIGSYLIDAISKETLARTPFGGVNDVHGSIHFLIRQIMMYYPQLVKQSHRPLVPGFWLEKNKLSWFEGFTEKFKTYELYEKDSIPTEDFQAIRDALVKLDLIIKKKKEFCKAKEYDPSFIGGLLAGIWLYTSIVHKQLFGRTKRTLFLLGEPQTGKSLLGKLLLKLGGVEYKLERGDLTYASLTDLLSQTTLPILVNDVPKIFNREEFWGVVLRLGVSWVARSRQKMGKGILTYVKWWEDVIPLLGAMIVASNKTPYERLEKDVLDRSFVFVFEKQYRIEDDKKEDFAEIADLLFNSRLDLVGKFIFTLFKKMFEDVYFNKNPTKEERTLFELWKKKPIEWSRQILKKLYQNFTGEIPDWLDVEIEEYKPEELSIIYIMKMCISEYVRARDLGEFRSQIQRIGIFYSSKARKYIITKRFCSLLGKYMHTTPSKYGLFKELQKAFGKEKVYYNSHPTYGERIIAIDEDVFEKEFFELETQIEERIEFEEKEVGKA